MTPSAGQTWVRLGDPTDRFTVRLVVGSEVRGTCRGYPDYRIDAEVLQRRYRLLSERPGMPANQGAAP